ncbi:MAG: hypothetical protein J6M48_01890 [Ruminococcus sp.]|nr:hypothetical protein [Ruminococcus sp.]
MKKLAAVLLCASLLWGCSDSKTESPVGSAPKETPTESPTAPKARDLHGRDMIVSGDQIDFIKNGRTVQTIKLDFSVKDEDIIFRDFNGDGGDDLFIPRNSQYGRYYIWDWNEMELVEAPEMGSKLLDPISEVPEWFPVTDGWYVQPMNGGNVYYYSSDMRMVMFSMEFYRIDSDGTEYRDYYSCKDGVKTALRYREKWIGEDQWQEEFVNPEQVYLEKTDTAIFVKLRSDDRVVQTIEGDFSGYTYQRPDNWIAAEGHPPDEMTLVNADMDWYTDFFVRTDPSDPNAGIYYRFDPDKLLFVESDLTPLWKQ